MKSKIFKIISIISMFFLMYFLIMTVFVKTPELIQRPSFIIIVYCLVCGVIIYKFKRWIDIYILNEKLFLIFLILLTSILRILWIHFVNTSPISDYEMYNNLAVQIINNKYDNFYLNYYNIFPFKATYSILISLIYKFTSINILYIKVFNIMLSIGTVVLVYYISKYIFEEESSARIASLLYCIWPGQIMLTSVLLPEHIFVILLLLSIQLFFKINKNKYQDYLLFSLLGIILALSNLIRPMAIIILFIYIIYIIVYEVKDSNILLSIKKHIKSIMAILISYIIVICITNIVVEKTLPISLRNSSSNFSLLIGTNYESCGMYNDKDASVLERFNYNKDKVNSFCRDKAFNRIKEEPKKILYLIEKKFNVQWTDENYSLYWSTYKTSDRLNKVTYLIKNHPKIFITILQIYYILILIFSCIGVWFSTKKLNYLTIIFSLIFLFFIFMHIFLEVQPRYHYPVIPILIILSGHGLKETYLFLYKHKN